MDELLKMGAIPQDTTELEPIEKLPKLTIKPLALDILSATIENREKINQIIKHIESQK